MQVLRPFGSLIRCALIDGKEQADTASFNNRVFMRMVFIRMKTRLARGSAAKTCTNDESVRADRCLGAEDEAIRA